MNVVDTADLSNSPCPMLLCPPYRHSHSVQKSCHCNRSGSFILSCLRRCLDFVSYLAICNTSGRRDLRRELCTSEKVLYCTKYPWHASACEGRNWGERCVLIITIILFKFFRRSGMSGAFCATYSSLYIWPIMWVCFWILLRVIHLHALQKTDGIFTCCSFQNSTPRSRERRSSFARSSVWHWKRVCWQVSPRTWKPFTSLNIGVKLLLALSVSLWPCFLEVLFTIKRQWGWSVKSIPTRWWSWSTAKCMSGQ